MSCSDSYFSLIDHVKEQKIIFPSEHFSNLLTIHSEFLFCNAVVLSVKLTSFFFDVLSHYR